jgi:hypothetical protein
VRPEESASLGLFWLPLGCGGKSLKGSGIGTYVECLNFPLPFLISAFTALADNHISHNSSLGYLGAVESKVSYPAPPQVPPTRYSPIPRHMLAEEDFTR